MQALSLQSKIRGRGAFASGSIWVQRRMNVQEKRLNAQHEMDFNTAARGRYQHVEAERVATSIKVTRHVPR